MSMSKILIFIAIFCSAKCALAAPTNRSLQIRLLAEQSGQFVAGLRGGRVHAHAARPTRSTKYFTTVPSPGYIRFESVKFRGKFLHIDHEKGKLKLGTPNNGSDIFEVQHLNDPVLSAFKNSENCYIAFDTEGNQVGPCGLNITVHYPEIKMRFITV